MAQEELSRSKEEARWVYDRAYREGYKMCQSMLENLCSNQEEVFSQLPLSVYPGPLSEPGGSGQK